MNKRNVIVISTIFLLIVSVLISLKMKEQSTIAQKEIIKKAEIILVDGTYEILLNKEIFEQSGVEKFSATLDTASTEPTKHNYTGVQLKNIIKSYVDLEAKTTVILSAADGYSVAYSIDEITKEGNVFIAFMEDDKYLGGMEDGGRGPYESIVVSDMFSNRRCKWITKIEVK